MQLHIKDMACGGCARSVKAAILSVDANAQIETDPPNRTVNITTTASNDAVRKVLSEAGFPATDK
ncbi:heavy-metal-associated domain-containing protein [Aquamicrobium sp. NLF2-7]|uniref:heavy-metal-associated domain-containing protein n=1 Tax=Aquamicrobium sp. NLF2-7 TaxID=2918753 RepID=UPI001EFA479D|nr:heavy-metal-associated domain-containing protein [Aquamicrobium sp. NLF2-7]MCG8274690.1 heavy-metal-associated domain-containing protein [Aquamicrobium sp. NLF2-7]